jgi:isopenicillin N synthase-like dioxygenase
MVGSSWHVPVVDISAYVEDGSAPARARVASEVDEACSTVGFIQILGHGIPAATIDGLGRAMDSFFDLQLDVKKRYRAPRSTVNRGYTAPKSESLSLSLGVESATRMNDFFEAFNVGRGMSAWPGLDLPADDYAENEWPEEAADFQALVSAYFDEAGRVARVLTHIFADALDVPPDFFERFTDHSIDVLRMNNYALPPGAVDLDGELKGMGEHTDFGIVTVLWADQIPGLQVLGTDKSWHEVSPADGALLINLGDITARWTNERWMSTLHRVMPPIIDGTIARRRSAAYFHDGNIDAVIDTIPSCLGPGGESPYLPVTVGEHIQAKLAGSRAGIRNEAATREAARVHAASI